MSPKRSPSRRAFIISSVALVTIGAVGLQSTPAQAQSFFSRIRDIINPQRRSQSASGRSRGGSVRGRCAAPELADTRLTALIPDTNVGLTVADYPTFWFYVPYGRTDNVSMAESRREPQSCFRPAHISKPARNSWHCEFSITGFCFPSRP